MIIYDICLIFFVEFVFILLDVSNSFSDFNHTNYITNNSTNINY